MGEIADMMLEGDLCTICGVVLEDGLPHPHPCPACENIERLGLKEKKKKKRGEYNGKSSR